MPELKSPLSILRAYVRQRVDESSLRDVAEEIGMSFSGLRSFLAGTSPHPSTVTKISDWYSLSRAGQTQKRPTRIARSEIDGAIALIAASLCMITDHERRRDEYQAVCRRIARDARLTNE